jgi:class 3 adenylate cyclase
MSNHSDPAEDALLDLGGKSNEDLRALLDDLYEEEQRISYRRRVLHGKIDILRSELVNRLKGERESGGDVITGRDVDRLIAILASDLRGASRFDVAAETEDEDWESGPNE